MLEVNCDIKLNPAFMSKLQKSSSKALEQTADQVYSDLVISQTMPFDTGNLQNVLTIVNARNDTVFLLSMGPYARRLYFHPEYNFQRIKNANAGARWFDPYLPGHSKEKFIPTVYGLMLKSEMGW